jgi:hypothetical protein
MCVNCGKLWISGDNLIFDELGGNEQSFYKDYFGLQETTRG